MSLRELDRSIYQSPFVERYASDEMLHLMSDDVKFGTWRRIWTTIGKVRFKMQAGVTQEQVDEMHAHVNDLIDYARVRTFEKDMVHDVISHQLTFAEACPLSRSIMHDGLTSCDITDNADLVILRQAMRMIQVKIARVIFHLQQFSLIQTEVPVLGYTHLKEASPVTLGKRVCYWIRDLLMIQSFLDNAIGELKLRGIKGTTGTQAQYLKLFKGDWGKVLEAEELFALCLDFGSCYPITGQTYSRLVDADVTSILSKLGAVTENMGWNLRMWAHLGEVAEPFGEKHRGSSGMPWKINPKYAERMCGIGRFLQCLQIPALQTYAVQIFERTLDDSVCRRLFNPESFLAADSVLRIMQFIAQSPTVHENVIKRNLKAFLPVLATENMLSAMVEKGSDRDEAYKRLQKYSLEAMKRISEGHDGGFFELIREDFFFSPIWGELDQLLNPSTLTGAAALQTKRFLETEVARALEPYQDDLDERVELEV